MEIKAIVLATQIYGNIVSASDLLIFSFRECYNLKLGEAGSKVFNAKLFHLI